MSAAAWTGAAIDIYPAGLEARAAAGDLVPTRLLVWDARGLRHLTVEGACPVVTIPGGALAPPQVLLRQVWRRLGLRAALVRAAAVDVAEIVYTSDGRLPPGGDWRRAPPPEGRRAPWQRPGWLPATVQAADAELARLGRPRTGRPEQMRHTSLTALVRLPTAAGPVWLKAVPSAFAHEPALARFVNGIAPEAAPTVLASLEGFWLAEAFPPETGEPNEDVLASLARVQIAAVGQVDTLRRLGCPDRRLGGLVAELSGLAERAVLAPAERHRLQALLPGIAEAVEIVSGLPVPDTLVHGDLSPGNARSVGSSWLIYDWTDGCIAPPFLDLASPLSYEAGEERREARLRSFAAAWALHAPATALDRALACAPLLGAAHQVATYGRLLDLVDPAAADQAGGDALGRFLRHWLDRLDEAARA